MNPALAARVEASVTRGKVAVGRRRPRTIAFARFGGVALVAFVAMILMTRWELKSSELLRSQSELLDKVLTQRRQLSESELSVVSRSVALLVEAADAEESVADEVKTTAKLSELLSKPAIYVRGKPGSFLSEKDRAAAIRDSVKDSFLLCLLEPPEANTEKALLGKVSIAYAGGLEKRTAHVRRLRAAAIGLPLLTLDWMKQVEDASSLVELGKLQSIWNKSPMDRAKAAAKSKHLIYVFDHPPETKEKSEFDGTYRHQVTVGMVHIPSGKPFFRVQTEIDPAWISDKNRHDMARGITNCRLAVDVRARLLGP